MANSGRKSKKYSIHFHLSLHHGMESMNFYRVMRFFTEKSVGLFKFLMYFNGRRS